MLRRWLLVLIVLIVVAAACGQDDTAAEGTATRLTIMPIGDSSTSGYTGWATYRCFLDTMLTDAGVSFDFVGRHTEPHMGKPYGCPTDFDQDHEGLWGAHIQHLSDGATTAVQELQPDVALILAGGNDLGGRQEPESVALELESFIVGLQAANADITVLVAQLLPCNDVRSACTEGQPALNAAIASFARLSTDESSVVVVDMETDFDFELLRDAVHPNETGERLMAERWMAGLQEADLIDSSR